ncbi:MAG: sigma-70 family RNA polymerase sigma factor [Rhodocyclaceae bacterium]|nr:sigma-70 family RNA polymerase sigma factor [Rhodocyclaceae bacterium]
MPANKPNFLISLFHDAREDLLSYVTRRVGSQDAEDIVQDTWLNLHQHGNPESWREPRAIAFATAGNLTVDAWRRQQVRKDLFDAADADFEPICPQPCHETVIDARRQVERLANALDDLPAACRNAFLLNRLEGLTHAQIADRLGVSTKTVQRHIERALSHCLARLAD